MKNYVSKYLSFCKKCKIYRPNMADHCPRCDNCIMVLDHHCPFVNNCVGKRNYQFFIIFIYNAWILWISLIIAIFFLLLDVKINKDISNILLVLVIIIGVLMTGLGVFFLTKTFIKGQTTT